MTAPIHEATSLLDHFLRSDWASCHIRGSMIEMFVAREPGHVNPMLASAVDESSVTRPEAAVLTAPHVGTLVELAGIGVRVGVGERYGVIELLGEKIDLVADRTGTICRHIRERGALIEYEDALVALN